MNHSNPPDAIDYERPREVFYMSTTPTDIPSDAAAAVDMNEGWLGDAWKAVKKFVGVEEEEEKKEEKEKEEKEKEPEGSKELEKLTKELEEGDKDKKKAPAKDKQTNLNLAYQSFFSKSHPIIGKLYSGPKDGKMNAELKAAVNAAEAKIGSEIGSSVSGMILATNPADVQGALAAIVKHQKGQKKTEPTLASLYLDTFTR